MSHRVYRVLFACFLLDDVIRYSTNQSICSSNCGFLSVRLRDYGMLEGAHVVCIWRRASRISAAGALGVTVTCSGTLFIVLPILFAGVMSAVLNGVHKVITTSLLGCTAYGFYVFGGMGAGIVRRRMDRWQEAKEETVDIDLPVPIVADVDETAGQRR